MHMSTIVELSTVEKETTHDHNFVGPKLEKKTIVLDKSAQNGR